MGTIEFPTHRRRRLLYYDPASQQAHSYIDRGDVVPYVCGKPVTDEQSFIDNRTALTFGTQVDTYLWHIGNGADPPYASPAEKILWPCLKSYEHASDLVVEACHANGMEVWASLRMNDLHSAVRSVSLADADDPFKTEHAEALMFPESARDLPDELTEQRLWMALNFALPEVRAYRLEFIERTAAAHDFDGYVLDFNRMGVSFPLGEERQHAPLLTDLIRQARTRLNAIGEQRGRPYTFVVHVMDSLEMSMELGMDVEAWLAEGLVDILLVGMGYLPSVLKIDQWVALGKRYGVQVYPSINTNAYRHGAWTELTVGPVYHEATRGSAAYYLQQGADGVYLFNFSNEPTQKISDDMFRAVLSDVGDPATLAGRDKVYCIQPTAHGGGPFYHGSECALLPIALDRIERKLPLRMGPDGDDGRAACRISLWVKGGGADVTLWVRLNHTLLPAPTGDGPWRHVEVPAGIMRSGYNELSLWCDVPSGGPMRGLVSDPPDEVKARLSPVIVHYVFVSVDYAHERRSGL